MSRKSILLILVLLAVGGAVLLLGQDIRRRAVAMQPASQAAESLAAGAEAKVIVRLDDAELDAHLLAGQGEGPYRATGRTLKLTVADGASVIMGSLADLTPGAVVQVEGVMSGESSLAAKKLVILTRFVKVEP
jgi:hypothetical protein